MCYSILKEDASLKRTIDFIRVLYQIAQTIFHSKIQER